MSERVRETVPSSMIYAMIVQFTLQDRGERGRGVTVLVQEKRSGERDRERERKRRGKCTHLHTLSPQTAVSTAITGSNVTKITTPT